MSGNGYPDGVYGERDEEYWASRRDEKKPYLIEWATKSKNDFASTEIYDQEAEAREEARRDGLRLFRIEWTEVEA